jgi:mono/diheme cytochrome c family protein
MQFAKSLPVLLLVAAACQPAPRNDAAAAESSMPPAQDTVLVAEAKYNPAMFDTVQWVTDSAHLARGADVFKWACATCHGAGGKGDGGNVVNGDTIHPPSFLAPDWRFANDEDGLRRRIYVGNARGMPHWGLRGIQPGDIVAVEKYILFDLRKGS